MPVLVIVVMYCSSAIYVKLQIQRENIYICKELVRTKLTVSTDIITVDEILNLTKSGTERYYSTGTTPR